MDIFMFLNTNNDEYLDIKKLAKLRDAISIEGEQQLQNMTDLLNNCPRGSIHYQEFVKIIE